MMIERVLKLMMFVFGIILVMCFVSAALQCTGYSKFLAYEMIALLSFAFVVGLSITIND